VQAQAEPLPLSPITRVGHDAAVARQQDDSGDRRRIPSVERVLQEPAALEWVKAYRRERVVEAVRRVLDEIRRSLRDGGDVPTNGEILARVGQQLTVRPGLVPVINATGIGLHTNLGRAPLAEAALDAIVAAARGAVNLEFDVLTGKRGERDEHTAADLCELTGAEAALVVNNNAAAVLLLVNTFALGREAIVSRGELVEIGGSFRMPEVMVRSGARLREVGTTNRTYLDDYRTAIGPDTGLLLKVHTSNYRIIGFTAVPTLAELVGLSRTSGIPFAEDLGSGSLIDLGGFGLPPEPLVRDRIAAGVDLVTFSGDKLLGGPQAGIIVGRRALVEQIAKNPLRRALRPDKLTLAALSATLRLYRDAPNLAEVLPVLRWLTRPIAAMNAVGAVATEQLHRRLGPAYGIELVDAEAEVGSGSIPAHPLPSRAIAITHPSVSAETTAARFRAASPPVIGRVQGGRFLLDLRGIDDPAVLAPELP
jgi:L-seryl-tRNA(Ser) seleniumtransferase